MKPKSRFPLAPMLTMIMACGAPDPAVSTNIPDTGITPQPPTPCAPSVVPLTQVDKINYTGGVFNGSTFEARRTREDCLDTTIPPRQTSCVSWTLPLPPAPAGLTREITLGSPIQAVSGGVAAWEGCDEHLSVDLWISDNVFDYLRLLTPGGIRVVDGVSSLTVAVCARGAAEVRVAPPAAVLRFVAQ